MNINQIFPKNGKAECENDLVNKFKGVIMTQKTQNEWFDPQGLEDYSHMKKSTQAKYRMLGKIPFCKIGKFIRYNKNEIDQWIASHKMGVVL